jgi:exodeoxyribonuclease VII small subunit
MKKFEERLDRLEEIGAKIQESSIPLEDALALFEEGMKLARGLQKDLEKIQGKIEILVNQPQSPEEKVELELFDDLSGGT